MVRTFLGGFIQITRVHATSLDETELLYLRDPWLMVLGPEIVRSWRGETSLSIRHPWMVAFGFGLIHGFGFAGALTNAGLPRKDLPLALLSFNLGVEIGQLSFVILILLLERSFRQLQIHWPRWVRALPGYAVGSLGAFWTLERTAILLGIVR